MAGDPYFDEVSLLLHCDGTNGSTTFTDSSNNTLTVTANGNAQISTAQSQFGSASGLFDGSGDYLSIPSNSLFTLDGDFTIEFWAYINTMSIGGILDNGASSFSGTAAAIVVHHGTATNRYSIWNYPTQTSLICSSPTTVVNQWDHVAFVRRSGVVTAYLNGVGGTSKLAEETFTFSATQLRIGKYWGGEYNGYIDDLRITKGVAIYTSDFTPPTAAFPDYQSYISGTLTESLSATDFKATAIKTDGTFAGTTNITNGSYTANIKTTEPVYLTIAPDIGDMWTASTAYALNDKVFSTDPATTPHYYECTTAGTSNSSEPTWPTSGTVNDGTVVWTYVEPLTQPITHGPLIPS